MSRLSPARCCINRGTRPVRRETFSRPASRGGVKLRAYVQTYVQCIHSVRPHIYHTRTPVRACCSTHASANFRCLLQYSVHGGAAHAYGVRRSQSTYLQACIHTYIHIYTYIRQTDSQTDMPSPGTEYTLCMYVHTLVCLIYIRATHKGRWCGTLCRRTSAPAVRARPILR